MYSSADNFVDHYVKCFLTCVVSDELYCCWILRYFWAWDVTLL